MEHIRIIAPGDPGFDWLYDLYMQSFPVHEQRLRERQEGVLGHPEYHCDLLCQGETRVGLLMWWAGPGFRYVEHFCVRPELRGRRYGAKALEELGRDGKTVVLEIDPPVDDISIRRRHFYERLGFVANPYEYIHPSFRKPFTPHQLILMSYPGPLTYDEARGFADFVRETVLGYSEHEAPTLPKLP